jgi:hypothetical protein
MARAKKCTEEFNPWPPFVDVFSSVILVLLLFIMVTIVNVAYYMQFNSKSASIAEKSSSKVDSLQTGKDVQDMISLQKVEKPALDKAGKDSLFSGGKAEGNSLTSSDSKKEVKKQFVDKKGESEVIIGYKDKGMFISGGIKSEIRAFIAQEKKKNPHAKFEISVAQPTNILGKTVPKQISLGRALNVKNMLKKMDVKLSDMSLKMKKNVDKKYGFGYVKIKVIK